MEDYRVVQILVEEFNRIYNLTLATAEVTLALFTMTGTFGAIRLGGPLAGILGCVAACDTVVLIFMLQLFSTVHSSSTKAMATMKRNILDDCEGDLQNRRKWFFKRLKALAPLKVSFLHIYGLRKVSVLAVVKILAENTVVLLITF